MKLTKVFLGMIVVVSISSCGNSQLESRITKLEGRVAALEGSGRVTAQTNSTTQPIANNNATASTATPTTPQSKPDGPIPKIKFNQKLHDFGKINEGDVVEHIFSFVNEGEAPLIISDAKATCGCTVPEWPREPIPVGEKGELKVRFDSNKKSGIINKTVTLTANTWPITQQIRIKADVLKKDGGKGAK